MEEQELYVYEHEKVELEKRGWVQRVLECNRIEDMSAYGVFMYKVVVRCRVEDLDKVYDIVGIPHV